MSSKSRRPHAPPLPVLTQQQVQDLLIGPPPTLLAHWQRVQGESEARLHTPYDEAQWAREWPERAALWKAREAAYWRSLEAGNAGV